MGSPWQGRILLAASILTSCFLQTQAQESTGPITLIPADAIQGQSITLKPDKIPARLLLCSWYRGLTITNLIITYYPDSPNNPLTGDAYTGRETVNADCSLLIRNLSPSDSGNYTLQYQAVGISQLGTASITVLAGQGCSNCLSSGQIAGIVIGCIAGVVLIAGILYFVFTKTALG